MLQEEQQQQTSTGKYTHVSPQRQFNITTTKKKTMATRKVIFCWNMFFFVIEEVFIVYILHRALIVFDENIERKH